MIARINSLISGKIKDGEIQFRDLRWDSYFSYLAGPIARSFILIPIFGYAVIFNDAIISNSGFESLVGETKTTFILNAEQRVRLAYFGMILIALGYALFLIFRPRVLRRASTQAGYLSFARENFTLQNFQDIHDRISREGAFSLYGEKHLDQWHAFKTYLGDDEFDTNFVGTMKSNIHFRQAIEKFEGLVRTLVIDHYLMGVRGRRIPLLICLVVTSLGYALILIPSVDLFLRVVQVSFFEGTS